MPRVSVAALRTVIARIEEAGLAFADKNKRVPLGHAGADTALCGGMLPGALHEIYAAERDGVSASAFAAMLALRLTRAGGCILWIRQDFTAQQCGEISAQGMFDLGIDPDRLLLVKTRNGTEALRATSDALSCKAIAAVVLEVWRQPKSLDLVASRKLTLRAAKSSITIFLIRIAAPNVMPSTAETRWFVRAAATPDFVEDWGNPLFEVTLARNRNGQTGVWVMEWSCDARVFGEIQKNYRPRISAPAGGSHQAQQKAPRRSTA